MLSDILTCELLLDGQTIWHWAHVLNAMLRMVTTQSNKLLAYWTRTCLTNTWSLPLASLIMFNYPLHFMARRLLTIGIKTLAGMFKIINTNIHRKSLRLTYW